MSSSYECDKCGEFWLKDATSTCACFNLTPKPEGAREWVLVSDKLGYIKIEPPPNIPSNSRTTVVERSALTACEAKLAEANAERVERGLHRIKAMQARESQIVFLQCALGDARADVERLKRWNDENANHAQRFLAERDAAREQTAVAMANLRDTRAEVERLQLQLAGCGVAAMANTLESAKLRITPDNPYYSASYSDVCGAVDKQMLYRAALEKAADVICSDFCGSEHHRFCVDARTALAGEGGKDVAKD